MISNIFVHFSVVAILCLNNVFARHEIKIGSVVQNKLQESRFLSAVETINNDPQFFTTVSLRALTVTANDVEFVPQAVCSLLMDGAVGIVGAPKDSLARRVQSECANKRVPFLDTAFNSDLTSGKLYINVFPHPPVLAKVFVDLVDALDWKKFIILYDDDDSFSRLSELFKYSLTRGYSFTFKRLDDGTGNYRSALREVKQSGETRFILDCPVEKIREVLLQAQQLGLMEEEHSYIVTSPDLHTLDLTPFLYRDTNITGIKLVDDTFDDATNRDELSLGTDYALMLDAVRIFAAGLKEIDSKDLQVNISDNICSSVVIGQGDELIEHIKSMELEGFTRSIKFDQNGFRSDFLLDIMKLSTPRLQEIGTWSSVEEKRLDLYENLIRETRDTDQMTEDEFLLSNNSFIVNFALNPPFMIRKESYESLQGNDRYEGFGVDLLDELSRMLGFEYTLVQQKDGIYGYKNPSTGEWRGMIKELIDGRADLLFADLTITAERENAVDFTMPFMSAGIGILFKKPINDSQNFLFLLSPFSIGVWISLILSYIVVSFLLFIVSRMSPREWENTKQISEENENLDNPFSILNSFWYMVGGYRGLDLTPKGLSSRVLAAVWWIFTVLMVCAYTARLVEISMEPDTPSPVIHNLKDLVDNSEGISYGALRHGATSHFFKMSDYPLYQRIFQYMESNPEAMSSTNSEGLSRVKTENYAYLMESSAIEYFQSKDCEVTQVGPLLNYRGYGLAMRKGSPYRTLLSGAILKLQEDGKIATMKIKWFEAGNCLTQESDYESTGTELDLGRVGGLFLLLLVGALLALLVACAEMLCTARSNSLKNQVPFSRELKKQCSVVTRSPTNFNTTSV